MNLPNLQNNNIEFFLNKEDIVRETAAQIMKDFGMFGIEITFSGDVENAYHELHEQLINQISVYLDRDYSRLMSVLNRSTPVCRASASTSRIRPGLSCN